MATRKECLDDLAKRTGGKRDNLDELLEAIEAHAREWMENGGLGPDEAYARARDRMLEEVAERAALRRRAEILDVKKEIALHRYMASVQEQIDKLPVGKRLAGRLAYQAARLALEAKLVGVNLPFLKNRLSVDAQFVATRRLLVGGMARDLEEAGLLKTFASRAIEDKWTDDLFEINRTGGKTEGTSGDQNALAIARVVQKWQRQSMAALNREGAWVRSYSGYITRTSHDADAIRAAGPEKWVADTLKLLDLKRTFGTSDMQRAKDALRVMWGPFSKGDHFDYGKPIEEPIYPNVGKQASASRELHFKTGADWRGYNEQYGVHNATHTVVQALVTGARRTALMKEFGTKPREAYDRTKNFVLAGLQAESERLLSRLGALDQAEQSAAGDAAALAKIAAEKADLRQRLDLATGRHNDFTNWNDALDNRFAQIDGSANRPINRTATNVVAGIMSVQRVSKLGNLFATHFASLPTKSMEASYWGIPFAQRFASLFSGFVHGAEGSARREAIDLTLAGFEHRLGMIMNAYDVADAPAGVLAQWETTFFKLTGVNAVIDKQRADFEAMAAAHVGSKRDLDWSAIGAKEQRVLQGFGIGEAEWKTLKGVEWTKPGNDRTYLMPSDALKLSDDQVRAYLKEAKAAELSRADPTAEDIARARENLALTIAAAYTDRSGYAIPMPSARIRAMLFGGDTAGSPWNLAKKLFFQFKIWPADMITRAWGREIYGRIGDGRLDRVSGLVETLVASIIFGVAAEGLRDLIKGQDPTAKIAAHPIAAILAGAQRSGMGSIVGDFLLGQFDRHGLSAAANLLGPTFGQIDDLMTLLHAGGRTEQGTLSPAAMRERAATLAKLLRDNTPFMNLWMTSLGLNTLIWHRLQEAISPGYLQRVEQRQRQSQGTRFWLSPAKTDEWLTGRRPATAPSGAWNLGS